VAKKKTDKRPTAGIDVGGSIIGSNITIGNNNQITHIPPPAPEIHAALGSIPPAAADTYVHRGSVESQIRAALRAGGASAIVGLHAPGGTGKTELATRIAQEVRAGEFNFEDVLWVSVNEKNAPDTLNEMLRLCGLQLQPNASETDKKAELHHFFLGHKFLVILDDVRAPAMQGLKDLLPPAPCAALITSRIQQMAGVRQFALDQMTPEQAREVFVNSLGEGLVQAEEETALKLAERCRYIPLALEIAARNILQKKSFASPISKYFERVEKNFEALKMHGSQRWDMHFVFDISYADLPEADRKHFRALAVFAPSGFSPAAAAHIWTALSTAETQEMEQALRLRSEQAAEILSRFINLSLVIPVVGDFERYRLHDLLDEYAMLKLREMGEEESAAASLAEWLINLFGEHYTDDISSAPEVGLEYENLAKMAGWAHDSQKGDLLALLATQPRNWLYNYFRELQEWLNWLESSLKIGVEDKGLNANVLQALGDLQQFRKETDAALESYNEALKLFRQVGDKLGEANVLKALGDLQQFRDDRDAALESYNEALKLFRQVGDKLGEANTLAAQGQMYLPESLEKANEFLNQALQMYQKIGSQYSIPAQIGNYGWKLYRLGEYEKAKPYLLQAADLFEKMGLMDYAERHRNVANKN